MLRQMLPQNITLKINPGILPGIGRIWVIINNVVGDNKEAFSLAYVIFFVVTFQVTGTFYNIVDSINIADTWAPGMHVGTVLMSAVGKL